MNTIAIKVVLNKCYGGFGLSSKAYVEFYKRKGIKLFVYGLDGDNVYYRVSEDGDCVSGCDAIFMLSTVDFGEMISKKDYEKEYYKNPEIQQDCEIDRTDKDLVAIVEQMGDEASGSFAKLEVDTVYLSWRISNHDGFEDIKIRMIK